MIVRKASRLANGTQRAQMGFCSFRATEKASSPHSNQSYKEDELVSDLRQGPSREHSRRTTGLCLCCKRYGDFDFSSLLVCWLEAPAALVTMLRYEPFGPSR
jgi:hypothetical protein